MENNIIYQKWDRDQTAKHYKNYYDTVYGLDNWPEEIYLAAVHFRDDLNQMVMPFVEAGYNVEDTYSGYGARLIHIFR